MIGGRTVLELGRVSNLPTVWSNVGVGWLLAGGGLSLDVVFLMLGGGLFYLGGMTLNDAAGARWDEEKGNDRPIVRGEVSVGVVWVLGFVWMVAGVLAVLVWTSVFWGAVVGLVVAILGYEFLHKRWSGCVWVMGMVRVFVYVMAGSAVAGGWPSEEVWAYGVLLGLYIVGVTAVARGEASGKVSGVAWVWGRVLLFLPLLPVPDRVLWFRGPFLVVALCAVVFLVWTWWAVRGMRGGGPAIGQGVGRLLAGIFLVDAVAVAGVAPYFALGLLLGCPLLLRLQRWVAAT